MYSPGTQLRHDSCQLNGPTPYKAVLFLPQVQLQPGPVAVAACTYSIQGTAQHMAATLVAGQEMVLCVETRDQYGNLARVPGECLQAQANGPQGAVRFAALEAAVAVEEKKEESAAPVQQQLGATLTAAGSYGLSVFIVDAGTGVRAG